MTKKEMFLSIRNVVVDNEEMVAFIDREIELLDKKNSAPKKPTARQVENEEIKNELLLFFAGVDAPKSIKEIQNECAICAELSNQRIARLLNDMVKDNRLAKTYIKKVAFFSIP